MHRHASVAFCTIHELCRLPDGALCLATGFSGLFGPEKCVSLVLNCLLLQTGNDSLTRSLGDLAEEQSCAHTVLSTKSHLFIKSISSCFCDAVASLTADRELDEESQSLAALLKRPAPKGKAFKDFVDISDHDEFDNFIQ